MSTMGGITRPLNTVLSSKAAKAQKIKSVKLKVKFKAGEGKPEKKDGN